MPLKYMGVEGGGENGYALCADDVDVKTEASKDKYQLVYIIFLLHGIGILMPWNMFITAHG